MTVTAWDNRQLCPDGACVGVIGDDGLCKTCGKVAPNWGDERRRGLKTSAELEVGGGSGSAAVRTAADSGDDGEDDDDDFDEDDDEDGEYDDDEDDRSDAEASEDGRASVKAPVAAKAKAGGDDWDQREVCSDGACIGVVGANGVCSVCGKSASG